MTSVSKNGFHLVYDMQTLAKVVVFLELAFGWDKCRSQKILERLYSLDANIPKAAVLVENNVIKIGILLFAQTDIKTNSSKIINMSSWYAEESHRGVDAVRFAKKLSSELAGFTITNYTPSPAVKKILTTLGYQYMNVNLLTYGVVKSPPFFQLNRVREHFRLLNNSCRPTRLDFDDGWGAPKVSYNFVVVKKFGLTFRTLNIFLKKDENFISLGWVLRQCLLNRILRVNLYSETVGTSEESPWLVKSFENTLYVHPQNSELSID